MRITVRLNGTNENPYHRMGLKCNPFPQTAKAEWDGAIMHMQQLGADPIPNVEHIRKHLKGWPQEFVDLCCQQFKPGKMVEFEVEVTD